MRLKIWLVAATAAVLAAGGSATTTALASVGHHASGQAVGASQRGDRDHGLFRVYAPYFETWTQDSISVLAKRSGAKFQTLAFIQSAGKKGAAACTITWDGVKKQPISAGRYVRQIAELRRHGGD